VIFGVTILGLEPIRKINGCLNLLRKNAPNKFGLLTFRIGSNYVIGIVTQNGHHLDWVKREIICSQRTNRPALIIADKGLKISPQYKVIRLDRVVPMKTISTVSIEIQKLIKDEETKNLVGGLVIGGLIILLISSLRGE